jgi:hypothetical protein
VIILGIACLVLGFLLAIPILWTLGIVMVVVGIALYAFGAVGGRHPVGGRRYWY